MEDSILQTADRALAVLELLARESLTAKDIGLRLNLNKSTVHRLLMTLLNRGFIERNEQSGIYRVGLKIVELGSLRLNQIELKTEALPYMHQLANRVNQSVQLAIYDEGEAVFIEKVEKYMSYHMYCQIGKRIPIYCSAVGKVLIMDENQETIRQRLKNVPMVAFTPATILNMDKLLDDIERGRREGFMRDDAEHEENVYCVAMPVRDYRGSIVAAVSITGFDRRVYKVEGEGVRKHLEEACASISARLGYEMKDEGFID